METIGDAYCVAGGLHTAHQTKDTHAERIAKMALKMMSAAKTVQSQADGTPIKVSEDSNVDAV